MASYRKCPRCTEQRQSSDFGVDRSRTDGLNVYCKPCNRALQRGLYRKYRERKLAWGARWREQNRERFRLMCREGQKSIRATRRFEALFHYSKGEVCCACCGESHYVFLALDHVEGGGNAHRREIRKQCSSYDLYNRLKANGYPEGFQVLCHNCNWAKAHGGCPHQAQLAREA